MHPTTLGDRWLGARAGAVAGALLVASLAACSSATTGAASAPVTAVATTAPRSVTPPPPPPAPTTTPAKPAPTAKPRSPLTGLTTGVGRRVLAVKVDNTGSAHPQQGLSKADVVYVEQVEGGLTRLMALFSSRLPQAVGPVRSARISDLHILRSYGKVAYAYSGAQGKLLPVIHRAPLRDVSAYHARGYYRVAGRLAPYNELASPRQLLRQAPGAARARDVGFRFGPPQTPGRRVRALQASWPAASIAAAWSPARHRWLLSMDGRPDLAAEGGQLSARTVVVQFVDMPDSRFHDFLGNYTPLVQVTGSGGAWVLRDGRAYRARWTRRGAGRTRFAHAGKPVTFAAGPTWVLLVQRGRRVTLR